MSIDAALLRAAQEGGATLRLYRWDPPCLSFGRNEPAMARYDREAIRELGIDTVRRPTGGRAVWHDAEVTYAVAAPSQALGTLSESYTAIHEMLAAAMRRLNVPAALARRPSGRAPRPSAGACFGSPAGGEIVVGDRKLIGSAQFRTGGALLQHGSILVQDGQDLVSRVTRGQRPAMLATSLQTILERPVDFREVAQAVLDAAREHWGGVWREESVLPHIGSEEIFSDTAWTWRR